MGKRICNQTRNWFVQYYQMLTLDLIGLLLAASIRRVVSLQTREECATVANEIFEYIFTCYRLSRMLFWFTLDFIGRKLSVISITIRMRKYKHKHSEILEAQTNKWSNALPEDIMQLVLQQPQLCMSDHRRCRAVCRSWRVAFASRVAADHPHELPWLMLCSNRLALRDHRFLSLSDQKIYKSNPTNYMNNIQCVGSIEGWLIMVDSIFRRPEGFMKTKHYGVTFFLNPISGARVMLPSQSTIPFHDKSYSPSCFFLKIKASPAPTSQLCVVAALCLGNHLAFCRPSDKSWTLIDMRLEFIDMAIIEGKLYAATWEASQFLMVFDIQDHANGCSPVRAKRLVMLHPMPVPSYTVTSRNAVMSDIDLETIYLSQDSTSKELFMIFPRSTIFGYEEDPIIPWHKIIGTNYSSPPHNAGFRVFKLEYRTNGPRWVELFDLGSRTLFISNCDSKLIPTAATAFINTLLQPNCIYFAFESPCFVSPSTGYDVGVFSLTKNTIQRSAFCKDHSRTRFFVRPIWFTPNP